MTTVAPVHRWNGPKVHSGAKLLSGPEVSVDLKTSTFLVVLEVLVALVVLKPQWPLCAGPPGPWPSQISNWSLVSPCNGGVMSY